MSKVFIEETTLSAIGDAIREKTGGSDLINPLDMPSVISSITTGSGEIEIPVFTGDCSGMFKNDNWTWAINNFGEKMETNELTKVDKMFYLSKTLAEIPFEINCKQNTEMSIEGIFGYCNVLEEVPPMLNTKPNNMNDMFSYCHRLKEIPKNFCDTWDWSGIDNSTTTYGTWQDNIFLYCYSLTSYPNELLKHNKPKVASSYYRPYTKTFFGCLSLKEIKDLPVPYKDTARQYSLFDTTFYGCPKAHTLTFERDENGKPFVAKWSNQNIKIGNYFGYLESTYLGSKNLCTPYTYKLYFDIADDMIIDYPTAYERKKNSPDWEDCITNIYYSHYNHDSAVETINSLPDTSAYLAEVGGTNTISFTGIAGSKTDAGGINTLTEEEIAVATSKGWTVSFI